jgi:CheY-like chemotaxis protein
MQVMLQNISSAISFCLHQASQARERAKKAIEPAIRRGFLTLEKSWMLLGRSEELTERLDRFATNRSGSATPSARAKLSQSVVGGATKSVTDGQIVVVDDARDCRQGLHHLVESLGYKCQTFETAEDYLRSELDGYTACLILDVNLPGMSGPDLQAHLIADGYCIPTVFVTGRFEERVRSRVLAAGAFGYLTKPLDENVLLNCIDAALNADR